MRPICMVVITTVLGMIPLVMDPFFGAMAAGLMFGLAFAVVLCLIVTPVLYAIFYGVRAPPSPAENPSSLQRPQAPVPATF
jgi:multidrug efflux pump subunit AcrB